MRPMGADFSLLLAACTILIQMYISLGSEMGWATGKQQLMIPQERSRLIRIFKLIFQVLFCSS